MKLETILNAMSKSYWDYRGHVPAFTPQWRRRYRQLYAFRDRILMMDAEKDEIIQIYKRANDDHDRQKRKLYNHIDELEHRLETIWDDLDD